MTDDTWRAPDWFRRAACTGSSVDFFPIDAVGVHRAQLVCAGCPVRTLCLEHALATGEGLGVWGGESERSRRTIARQRARNVRNSK